MPIAHRAVQEAPETFLTQVEAHTCSSLPGFVKGEYQSMFVRTPAGSKLDPLSRQESLDEEA